ncbi:MAG: peroxiredoxin [Nevskia sp.]|nr:peroxiredoxin [Nevskia sp.]
MSTALKLTRRLRLPLIATLLSCALIPAEANLKAGAKAPDFSAQASLGGVVSTFSLTDTLKQGPVVLYFYPAAFTSGCTIEAHDFAEATEQFKALGATVVGVSHDDIATLNKFSVSECRSKFAVAADPDQKISKSYDATMWYWPGHSDRTSYLIAPDGSIIYTYSALAPDGHVKNLLAALKDWKSKQKS